MATSVPIDLLRLRSATATYVTILTDSLPSVEALIESASTPDGPAAKALTELHDSLRAAVEVDDAPGTPAAILNSLAYLLGEAETAGPGRRPAAGAGRLRRPLPHIGASPPVVGGRPKIELTDDQWDRIDVAFWEAVAAEFPEVEAADLDPFTIHKWKIDARQAIDIWLMLNHPAEAE